MIVSVEHPCSIFPFPEANREKPRLEYLRVVAVRITGYTNLKFFTQGRLTPNIAIPIGSHTGSSINGRHEQAQSHEAQRKLHGDSFLFFFREYKIASQRKRRFSDLVRKTSADFGR